MTRASPSLSLRPERRAGKRCLELSVNSQSWVICFVAHSWLCELTLLFYILYRSSPLNPLSYNRWHLRQAHQLQSWLLILHCSNNVSSNCTIQKPRKLLKSSDSRFHTSATLGMAIIPVTIFLLVPVTRKLQMQIRCPPRTPPELIIPSSSSRPLLVTSSPRLLPTSHHIFESQQQKF